jgi:catechol 2,3-dioxygenase-like lactoylglutathione lyase family enzyme
MTEIKGLHHNAYRCRDSEETRAWYEEFLGLRFVSAFEIEGGHALHTFFEMADGSCLAFFEVPGKPFDFKEQSALDLHIALGVEPTVFDTMLDKAKAAGREVGGPIDHGFCRSTANTGTHDEIMDPARSKPHEALARWQATKDRQVTA